MTRAKVTRLDTRSRARVRAPTVSVGLHAGTVELASRSVVEVRLASGQRVPARLEGGIDPGLLDECLREKRTVLVSVEPTGARVLGALQTTRSVATRVRPDALELSSDEIELSAVKQLRLRVGTTVLVLDAEGEIRAGGRTLTLRLGDAMRVLAPNVELP